MVQESVILYSSWGRVGQNQPGNQDWTEEQSDRRRQMWCGDVLSTSVNGGYGSMEHTQCSLGQRRLHISPSLSISVCHGYWL